MKTSEIIQLLQDAMQEHGDLEMALYDSWGEYIQQPMVETMVVSTDCGFENELIFTPHLD